MDKNKKIGIIGGGITGLSLAYFISQKGYLVDLYEKEKFLGGLLGSFKLSSGKKLEKFYHHFFKQDKDFLKLIKEIGLKNEIRFFKNSTSIFKQGRYYSFSNIFDYLRFPFLNFRQKIPFFINGFLFSRSNWQKFEGITSKELIINKFGSENWQVLWQNLFEKKFQNHADKIPAAWFWWRSKNSLNSGGKLGYFKSGFETLIIKLTNRIKNNKGGIYKNDSVEKIFRKDDKIFLNQKSYDIVISTLPSEELEKISPVKIESKNYLAVINVILELRNRQTKYYWNNILDKKIPFVGLIEHTNLISSLSYRNKNIIYLTQYLERKSNFFNKTDLEIISEYKKHFRIVGINKKDIINVYVFRSKYGQPIIINKNNANNFKTSIKNLFSLSGENIYPEDRGVNQAIREAKKLAEFIDSC